MTTAAKQPSEEAFRAWEEQFRQDGRAAPLLLARSDFVDQRVIPAYEATLGASVGGEAALLAVGGYGRHELFPHSDVDLLILVGRALHTPALKSALSEFVRTLWDSNLRASHSVRTPEECATLQPGNLELTISLLDNRYLAGSRELHVDMLARFQKFLISSRREICRELCKAARARHARFHNTIFRLEPEVKEGPGGLRDWHVTRWLGQLGENGATGSEGAESAQFIAMTRCLLHFRNGRDYNLLDFESQDAMAASGLGPTGDPAEWMGAWYRNASDMLRWAETALEAAEARDRSLLSGFKDWRSRLSNSDITVSRDLVFLRNPSELDTDPSLALRLFCFVARHGARLSRETEQRIRQRTATPPARARDVQPEIGFWRELLSLPQPSAAIRAMRATQFLPAVLPEWKRIDHLVVRDFYHRYTVDEHTTVALEIIEDLSKPADEWRRALAEILEECEGAHWLLRLAALFHDIGKGSGQDHTEESVRLAREFLTRADADRADLETILFLVSGHLLLSAALQTRDVADPAVLSSLAKQIRTAERLKLLTLLTYADISAVYPGAMTPWRAAQLLGLYRALYQRLEADLISADLPDPRGAMGELSAPAAEFLEGLPARYLWTHTAAEAEQQARLYFEARTSGAEAALDRSNGAWRLTAIAADHPFLFAALAGVLSSFGLEIVRAEAFTNLRGYVVDTFLFFDPHRCLDLNPPEQDRLCATIRKAAAGRIDVESLLRGRPGAKAPARSAALTPAVAISQDISPAATVVEVSAQDRPGLLYSLASTISRRKCDIGVVLVDTRAHKAIDVFYVTQDGGKITDAVARELKEELTAACLGPSARAGR